MSHFITTHDTNVQSKFSSTVPQERHVQKIPGGSMEIVWGTHDSPPDLSTESDIDQYAHDRQHGFGHEHPLCPPGGTAAAIVTMEPNATSLMHRTMTLDVTVVIEGVLELHLDSGEVRTLRAGDSVTQRGTMHKWVNVTPDDGVAKMAGFAVAIAEPFEIAGKRLEMQWIMG